MAAVASCSPAAVLSCGLPCAHKPDCGRLSSQCCMCRSPCSTSSCTMTSFHSSSSTRPSRLCGRIQGSPRSMAPDEEKMTRRSPLDFPIEWERPRPGRRPDIFPQFSPMKTPLPQPPPTDPPEEDEEEEEKKEEEKPEEDPDTPPKET